MLFSGIRHARVEWNAGPRLPEIIMLGSPATVQVSLLFFLDPVTEETFLFLLCLSPDLILIDVILGKRREWSYRVLSVHHLTRSHTLSSVWHVFSIAIEIVLVDDIRTSMVQMCQPENVKLTR